MCSTRSSVLTQQGFFGECILNIGLSWLYLRPIILNIGLSWLCLRPIILNIGLSWLCLRPIILNIGLSYQCLSQYLGYKCHYSIDICVAWIRHSLVGSRTRLQVQSGGHLPVSWPSKKGTNCVPLGMMLAPKWEDFYELYCISPSRWLNQAEAKLGRS